MSVRTGHTGAFFQFAMTLADIVETFTEAVDVTLVVLGNIFYRLFQLIDV